MLINDCLYSVIYRVIDMNLNVFFIVWIDGDEIMMVGVCIRKRIFLLLICLMYI